MKFVYGFDEAKDMAPGEIGNKSFNLLKLYPEFNIPKGVIITSSFYDCFTKDNSLGNQLERQLKEKLPDIGEFFSVRSSSTNEDSKNNSFAGQYSTFCGIRTNDVPDYAIKVFNSLNSSRSAAYKKENYINGDKMAVLIQEMVPCEKSGVIFTIDPVKNNKKNIIIEAAFGLGEYVVSGVITPDNYVCSRENNVFKLRLGFQDKKLVFEEGKIKELSIKKEGACLTDNEVNSILLQAKSIENLFNSPQDIEWGIFNNKLYIFQARAITGIE